VTGVTGFIGGAVARSLTASGHEVVGFGRRVRAGVAAGAPMGSYRIWDLALGPLVDPPEVDAVVHAAALADDWAPLAEARAVNVGGSRAVLASFPGARFVHLSSSSVYDNFRPTVNAAEATPPATRFLSSYSQSKAEAEAVFALANSAILRPHAVYGPGDTTLLPRVLAALHSGRMSLPGGSTVLHTLTSIDNLVQAVTLGLASDGPPGVFNIGDAEPVILSIVLREILEKKTGSSVTIRPIPYRMAAALAVVAETGARLGGRRPSITRYAVSQLGLERTLDLTAARERLGYRPTPTSVDGAEHW
jgi:nucleoside-diphosphate-sugar epimerase